MRSLVLATVSALALGIAGAGPVYAQGNAGATSPAPVTPSTAAPANPAQPAMPQASMGSGSQYRSSPYMANSSTSSRHSGAMHMTGSDIRQAQEQLKGEGPLPRQDRRQRRAEDAGGDPPIPKEK